MPAARKIWLPIFLILVVVSLCTWLVWPARVQVEEVVPISKFETPNRTNLNRGGNPDHKKGDFLAQMNEGTRSISKLPNIGQTPLIPQDANDYVISVAEALKHPEKFPERLSPAIAPPPFDKQAFKDDPEKYLKTVEPGRVFQPAQPGVGIQSIQRRSPKLVRILQNETAFLRVWASPGAPVTYTSFDLGQFENLLTSITVLAGDDGIATAEFTGSPGTVNDVNILVASPVNSGQIRFIVNISIPK